MSIDPLRAITDFTKQVAAFRQVDSKDGKADGEIVISSVPKSLRKDLASRDVDQNGKVTIDEYTAGKKFVHFDTLDGKRDGKINLDSPAFAKVPGHDDVIDENEDNLVHLDEFMRWRIDADTNAKRLTNFINWARKAEWSENEITQFIELIVNVSPEKSLATLEELASYYGHSNADGVLRDFRKQASFGNQQKGFRPIVEILSSLKASPEQKLDILLSSLAVVAGIYNRYVNDPDVNENPSKIAGVLLNYFVANPMTDSQGRELLWQILSNWSEEIFSMSVEKFTDLVKTITKPELTEEQLDFVAYMIPLSLDKTVNKLSTWISLARTMSETDCKLLKRFSSLVDIGNVNDLRQFLSVLKEDQVAILETLVSRGNIKDVKELKEIASRLGTFQVFSPTAVCRQLTIDDLNPAEQQAYLFLQTMVLSNFGEPTPSEIVINEILDYISSINTEVSKVEGYSGTTETLAQIVDWDKVLALFSQTGEGMQIEQFIGFQLESELSNLPKEATLEQVKVFLKRVPSRSIFEAIVDSPGNGYKLKDLFMSNWKDIRTIAGHIFLRDDKAEYARVLAETLAEQGITLGQSTREPSFSAALKIINLNDLHVTTLAARFVVLGENKVLVIFKDSEDQVYAKVVNPKDPNSFRNFLRELPAYLVFTEDTETPYGLIYFPKIEFQPDGSYIVSTNYNVADGRPEILLGKGDVKGEVTPKMKEEAYASYKESYANEAKLTGEAKAFWQTNLTGRLAWQAKAEPYIDVDDLFGMILVMDSSGAKRRACRVLGISEAQYDSYESQIKELLAKAHDLTPQEFLAGAIRACDGRPMLASLISYNYLWSIRGNFLQNYPEAFKGIQGASDPAGAIYHYFGTFFSAYSIQKCLVQRYQTDENFKGTIDAKVAELKSRLVLDPNKKWFTGISGEEMALFMQYRFIQMEGESHAEIITISGIGKEEVFEDGDALEIKHDFIGMTSGHGLFEQLYGAELKYDTTDRAVSVKAIGRLSGIKEEVSMTEKLKLARVFDLSISELISLL